MRVYVENVEKVTTNLYSFSEEVTLTLKGVLLAIANRIASRARANLGAYSKTGKLAGSIRTTVKAYQDRLVSASVIAGGRRNARYAHAFERGFNGTVRVKEHTRGHVILVSGWKSDRWNVRSYERRHIVKAHGFLDAALKAETADAPLLISNAIGAVAKRKGLS